MLRQELLQQVGRQRAPSPPAAPYRRDPRDHELRNRLNAMAVRLHVLQRRCELQQLEDANELISVTLGELQKVNDLLEEGSRACSASPIQKLRALIVDDSKTEAALLAEYLRTHDYEVFTVENGIECLDFLASQTRPDVVLLDVNMPRMDGKAAIERIRQNPQHDGIKLFAVSGISQSMAGIELGPRGVDRWFTKPIQPAALVDELRKELSTSSF